MPKRNSPARTAINQFGGVRPLARTLGVSPSTVCRWDKPRSKGGSGGSIPAKYQYRILSLARKRNIRMRASDLIAA